MTAGDRPASRIVLNCDIVISPCLLEYCCLCVFFIRPFVVCDAVKLERTRSPR